MTPKTYSPLGPVNAKNQALDEKSQEKILRWLDAQDAYTLHRPARRKFPRLRYDVTNIDDVWECDFMQLTTIKKDNDGDCYLLVVVDVLSKYAWVEPLRDHSGATVLQAFKKILDDKRSPQLLQSDEGSEFHAIEYNVGTHVRISRYKATFEKGYASNFTEEIFQIKRVSLRQEIYTYVLEDLNGEEIDGFFCSDELAPVSDKRLTDDRFKIEKVIRKRGKGARKEAYVKWSQLSRLFQSVD
ncbi:hypothetical protein TKK_0015390 [Trichogramma kaykai]